MLLPLPTPAMMRSHGRQFAAWQPDSETLWNTLPCLTHLQALCIREWRFRFSQILYPKILEGDRKLGIKADTCSVKGGGECQKYDITNRPEHLVSNAVTFHRGDSPSMYIPTRGEGRNPCAQPSAPAVSTHLPAPMSHRLCLVQSPSLPRP